MSNPCRQANLASQSAAQAALLASSLVSHDREQAMFVHIMKLQKLKPVPTSQDTLDKFLIVKEVGGDQRLITFFFVQQDQQPFCLLFYDDADAVAVVVDDDDDVDVEVDVDFDCVDFYCVDSAVVAKESTPLSPLALLFVFDRCSCAQLCLSCLMVDLSG